MAEVIMYIMGFLCFVSLILGVVSAKQHEDWILTKERRPTNNWLEY